MKTYHFYSFFGLLLGFIFLSKSCPPPSEVTNYTQDCYEDRETERELTDAIGTILKIGATDTYAIQLSDEGQRFGPCNLEGDWKKEGLKVRFSGKVKVVQPNERWPATPFVLTAIQKH